MRIADDHKKYPSGVCSTEELEDECRTTIFSFLLIPLMFRMVRALTEKRNIL